MAAATRVDQPREQWVGAPAPCPDSACESQTNKGPANPTPKGVPAFSLLRASICRSEVPYLLSGRVRQGASIRNTRSSVDNAPDAIGRIGTWERPVLERERIVKPEEETRAPVT